MKRRKFIRNLSAGIPPVLINPELRLNETEKKIPVYQYQQPEKLEDAISKNGQIILRFEITSENRWGNEVHSKIKIQDGKIDRIKAYFFEESEDSLVDEKLFLIHSVSAQNNKDIVVLWLTEFSEKTTILLSEKREKVSFNLNEIIKKQEIKREISGIQLKVNFLLDKEISKINPEDLGIEENGDEFTFIIMADPQGADVSDPDDNRCRSKIHNAFIEESIRLAKNLKQKPAFCLMLGDIVDYQGEARDFAQMDRFFKKLNMPVLYEMGNHESKYSTKFEPGYNLAGFNNYFAAQKAINGMDELLYSFNLGKWHFIVWPDPLRKEFWENHPHYFDWLEQDLEKHKNRPTLFFQHIPMHPIGINPLINYTEQVAVKRLLFQILAKHGNVKNIYSGHVHIPVKSSFKTAVEISGINCINLPAAGYRPRSFGEEDYYGGPSQGICIVDIKDKKINTTYKTVTGEEFKYPKKLKKFDAKKYPLWFSYKWELPAQNQFVNGNFENDLLGWGRRFVYNEDENPANICEIRNKLLYLKTEKRAFHTPGQDRLPQDINRIFQAVNLQNNKNPLVSFEYKLDGKNCDFGGFNGLYIALECFSGSNQLSKTLYFSNKAWVNVGGTYSKTLKINPIIFSLNETPEVWHKVQINIKKDFEKNKQNLAFGNPDRLVFTAGIWNINDGKKQPFAAFLKNIQLDYNSEVESNISGNRIELTPEHKKWWRGKLMPAGNVAGEHHYHMEDLNNLKY